MGVLEGIQAIPLHMPKSDDTTPEERCWVGTGTTHGKPHNLASGGGTHTQTMKSFFFFSAGMAIPSAAGDVTPVAAVAAAVSEPLIILAVVFFSRRRNLLDISSRSDCASCVAEVAANVCFRVRL